jgi:hypothetical protein
MDKVFKISWILLGLFGALGIISWITISSLVTTTLPDWVYAFVSLGTISSVTGFLLFGFVYLTVWVVGRETL